MSDLKFRVGPWEYRVVIWAKPLKMDGKRCWGLCDWSQRTIKLSADLPAAQRVDLLCHEMREAWWEHFGRPGDREADCNQVASFCVDFMRQLLAQGGEPALMEL